MTMEWPPPGLLPWKVEFADGWTTVGRGATPDEAIEEAELHWKGSHEGDVPQTIGVTRIEER